MIIYTITNKINGKIYVGQTIKKAEERFYNHVYAMEKNMYPNIKLYRAMKKYGVDNFELKTIDVAKNFQELDDKEIFWIEKLKTKDDKYGYNMSDGGNTTKGRKFSEESKEKMRKKSKERFESGFKLKGTSVIATNLKGETLGKFISIAEASRHSEATVESIRSSLGKTWRVNGFFWKYSSEKINENVIDKFKRPSIGAFDSEGNLVYKYKDILFLIDEIGLRKQMLNKALEKNTKYRGFFWKEIEPQDNCDVIFNSKTKYFIVDFNTGEVTKEVYGSLNSTKITGSSSIVNTSKSSNGFLCFNENLEKEILTRKYVFSIYDIKKQTLEKYQFDTFNTSQIGEIIETELINKNVYNAIFGKDKGYYVTNNARVITCELIVTKISYDQINKTLKIEKQ